MQSTSTDIVSVSDQVLIDAARQGEHAAFEELVKRYQNRLFTSIRNDVGCPVIAEDIVQEAFVRAFRFLDSFRSHSRFYTWLYRIALNLRRTHLRKRPHCVSLDAIKDFPQLNKATIVETPAQLLEREDVQQQVRMALNRLKEHHRTILILREFEGFDYQTIAEVMQLNKGTVRSRLARARARLREELKAYVASDSPAMVSQPVEEHYDYGCPK